MTFVSENPLVIIGIQEIVEDTTKKSGEWSIEEDRDGLNMAFYKNIPVDEIIYCIGEVSLSMTVGLHSLQQEYYDCGNGDVFNVAMKLIRDNNFAKEFYLKYDLLKEKL